MEKHFASSLHRDRFLIIMTEDGTHPDDSERASLFISLRETMNFIESAVSSMIPKIMFFVPALRKRGQISPEVCIP